MIQSYLISIHTDVVESGNEIRVEWVIDRMSIYCQRKVSLRADCIGSYSERKGAWLWDKGSGTGVRAEPASSHFLQFKTDREAFSCLAIRAFNRSPSDHVELQQDPFWDEILANAVRSIPFYAVMCR